MKVIVANFFHDPHDNFELADIAIGTGNPHWQKARRNRAQSIPQQGVTPPQAQYLAIINPYAQISYLSAASSTQSSISVANKWRFATKSSAADRTFVR